MWLTYFTSLVDFKQSPEFPCQRYQHSTQWPVTEAPASVAGFFVAQTRVLRLPLDNLQHPLSLSCCGVEVCVAATELPVSLREREEGRERGGEREKSESGSRIELRAWALLFWVPTAVRKAGKNLRSRAITTSFACVWILGAHGYQD